MKRRIGAKKGVHALLALALTAFGGAAADWKGGAVTYAAETASSKTDYSVSGDQLIWMEPDGSGVKQIHYRNNATGEERTLTSSQTAKDAPYLYGDNIVWADKGDEDEASLNWDIYRYDLQNGEQTELNAGSGAYSNPTIDADGAVWYDREQYGEMLYEDLDSGAIISLGEGRFPVLADGIVVYKNARDGGLSMLKLESGVRRSLVSFGGSSYVDWFVFNGDSVLWKQKNGSGESKYVSMLVTDPAAEPVDLTEMSVKNPEYAFMSIGDTQAAFLVEENGEAVLRGVDLADSSTYIIDLPVPVSRVIGFSSDLFLYVNEDESLDAIDLGDSSDSEGGSGSGSGNGSSGGGSSSGSGNSGSGSGSSSSSGGPAEELPNTAVIGPKGGSVASPDGKAQAAFPAGAFGMAASVGLGLAGMDGSSVTDEQGHKLEAASGTYKLASSLTPFTASAALTIAYDEGQRWLDNREKLGIYTYDAVNGYWSYVGGITGKTQGEVSASIDGAGIYAVMLREVSFADAAGHWAQNEIETLASRGIVNGMQADVFQPNGKLTRAEFAKLLVGALGMKPAANGKATFKDVQSDAWYYGWVEAAAAAGIVQGSGDTFGPSDPLTREQMMTMLIRAAGERLGADDAAGAEVLAAFADSEQVSGWASASAAAAVQLELVQGSGGQLDPQGTSTRAQAAAVIYRLLDKLELL